MTMHIALAVLAISHAGLGVRLDGTASSSSPEPAYQKFVLSLSAFAWLQPDADMLVLPETGTRAENLTFTVAVVHGEGNSQEQRKRKLSDLQRGQLLPAASAVLGPGQTALFQSAENLSENATFPIKVLPRTPMQSSAADIPILETPVASNVRPMNVQWQGTNLDPGRPGSWEYARLPPHYHDSSVLHDASAGFSTLLLDASVQSFIAEFILKTADEPEVKAEKFIDFIMGLYELYGGLGGRAFTVAKKLINDDPSGATVSAVISGLAVLIRHQLLDTAVIEAVARFAVSHHHDLGALDLSTPDALHDVTKLSHKAVKDEVGKSTGDETAKSVALKLVCVKLKVALSLLNIWKIAKAINEGGGVGDLAEGFDHLQAGDQHPWQHLASDMSQHLTHFLH